MRQFYFTEGTSYLDVAYAHQLSSFQIISMNLAECRGKFVSEKYMDDGKETADRLSVSASITGAHREVSRRQKINQL